MVFLSLYAIHIITACYGSLSVKLYLKEYVVDKGNGQDILKHKNSNRKEIEIIKNIFQKMYDCMCSHCV